MILIDLNVKEIFNMFQQFSNTLGLVKYIFDGSIQKGKVLRFFCGSVYFIYFFGQIFKILSNLFV